ncbi:hypothetical protein NA57DRAFT_79236 [Rhizodiscina lignyota]|uniref:Uncharacterized protein n=1 Tax=Rhizodiscina lignyota TaxID=1504668 RepID=A0A9P4M765_9PEZI|nr:hypothetical protein NA57DRAFT_79236 [Rhizodiscina lignyota]
MGNTPSKSESDPPVPGNARPRAATNTVRRRPVGSTSTWRGVTATAKDEGRKKLPSPLGGMRELYSKHVRSQSNDLRGMPTSPDIGDGANDPPPKQSKHPPPAESRRLPPTPPNEDSSIDVSGVSSASTNQQQKPQKSRELSTPPLNSPQLPPTAHIPEETPSKYGITQAGGAEESDENDNQLQVTRSRHFRGKSSTGFDIFKATAALQKAHSYLNTISPPTSRPETPITSPKSTMGSGGSQANESPEPRQSQNDSVASKESKKMSKKKLKAMLKKKKSEGISQEPEAMSKEPEAIMQESKVMSKEPEATTQESKAISQKPKVMSKEESLQADLDLLQARDPTISPFPAYINVHQDQLRKHLQLAPSVIPPSFASSTVKDITPLIQTRPEEVRASYLSVIQTKCKVEHRRWRQSNNAVHPVACALCFTNKDELTGENGEWERWSCIWCALRVCLPCRNKVEVFMGRDPEKVLIGSEIEQIRAAQAAAARQAGPPSASSSTGEFGAGSGRGSAMSTRRGSPSPVAGRYTPTVDMNRTPMSTQRRPTQMSKVMNIDDDVTPRNSPDLRGKAGKASADVDSLGEQIGEMSVADTASPTEFKEGG